MARGHNAGVSGTLDFIPSAVLWDAATLYQVGDVVDVAGTKYICILTNSNQTPPNVTYWTVVGSPAFTANVTQFSGALTMRPINRTGPGAPWLAATTYAAGQIVGVGGTKYIAIADSTNYTPPNATYWTPLAAGVPMFALADLRGGGVDTARVATLGYPLPANMQYATGTIKRSYNSEAGDYISYPIVMHDIRFNQVEESGEDGRKEDEHWHMSYGWLLAGPITIVWQGTQISFNAPPYDPQPTYEGTQKYIDPNDIASSAVTRWDFRGVVDTDSAWAAAIANWIAAAFAAPVSQTKLIGARLERSEDDAGGGAVVMTWGKMDSKDQHEVPATWTLTDQSGLQSTASVGLIDATPSAPTGFVLREIKAQAVVGKNLAAHTLNIGECGLRSTAEDQEFPGTFVDVDVSDLRTEGRQTIIFDNTIAVPAAAVPSGLQTVSTTITKETGDRTTHKSKVVYGFRINTPAQEIVYQATHSTRSNISPDQDVTAEVYSDSTSTVAQVANVQYSSHQADPYFFGLSAKRINGRKVKWTLQQVNPGILQLSTLISTPRMVMARVNPTATPPYMASDVQVYVAMGVSRGIGSTYPTSVHITRTLIHTPIRLITLRRNIQSSAGVPDYPGWVDSVNNAAFRGLAAGLVFYRGAVCAVRIDKIGMSSYFIDYNFTDDPAGNFQFSGFRQGNIPCKLTASALADLLTGGSGWVAATDLDGCGLLAAIPPTNNFDVFTT